MSKTRLTRIGKYEVEAVVGEGAMGVVYCALDTMLNRRVAIKVMSDAIAQDTDLRERFLREAQAAGSLQHPNVVTIYDFGEIDGHLYIAMEYVEGDDLEDLMRTKIPLSLEAKLELIIGVLQGLAFAHKRGVIHRDVKPANIRVDAEGKARLMDFGVAHLASSNMTATGVMLGTPSYMAPEQILGASVSPETDIFSVGAVLYELLTNVRPFRGDTLQTLMYQILSTMPVPVHTIATGIPEDLNRVVMRALQKEPKARYSQALDMADELSAIRSSLVNDGDSTFVSLRATIDTALANRHAAERRRVRRRKSASIAGGVLVSAAAIVLVWEVASRFSGSTAGSTAADSITATTSASSLDASSPELAEPSPPPPRSADTGASVSPRTPPATSTVAKSAPATPVSTAPTSREISLARTMQTNALDGRRRAIDAGATADQLRAGDNHNSSGESLLNRGRVTEAAAAFSNASAAWLGAERAARDASAAARAKASTSAVDTPPVVGAPVASRELRPEMISPPPVTPAPAPPPPAPAGNPPAEINAVVAAYERAMEARDIAQLQHAFPGMTAGQRRGFEDFFRSTRSLSASLAVGQLRVDGATATAQLSGTYAYVTTAGDSERRQVSFQATFRRDVDGWRLTALR